VVRCSGALCSGWLSLAGALQNMGVRMRPGNSVSVSRLWREMGEVLLKDEFTAPLAEAAVARFIRDGLLSESGLRVALAGLRVAAGVRAAEKNLSNVG